MNDCELNIEISDEEMERIKKILTKDKGIKHYLLKISNNEELDVVEYKEYKNLQQRIDKAIDKLYCWGETLNSNFQNEMLSILQDEEMKDYE